MLIARGLCLCCDLWFPTTYSDHCTLISQKLKRNPTSLELCELCAIALGAPCHWPKKNGRRKSKAGIIKFRPSEILSVVFSRPRIGFLANGNSFNLRLENRNTWFAKGCSQHGGKRASRRVARCLKGPSSATTGTAHMYDVACGCSYTFCTSTLLIRRVGA